MGGGLMQLVAYGAQDIYLTGNPQITFFKVVYRRHTNFSMECIQQTFNGSSAIGSSASSGTVTIARNGDLVTKMYVRCNQNTTTGISGDNLITDVTLEIGGQKIDKHTKEWLQIWAELTTPESKAAGYKYLTGGFSNTLSSGGLLAAGGTAQQSIMVPLQFWFCRNPGLALPLIALQYHEVKVIFTWATSATDGTGAGRDNAAATPTLELWTDYIYLDTDERRRFAQVSHEYLIEQLQYNSEGSAAAKYRLNWNHPVKELVWTNTSSDITTQTAKITLNGHDRFSSQTREYFQIRQPLDHHTAVPGYNIKETEGPHLIQPIVIAYRDAGTATGDAVATLHNTISATSGTKTTLSVIVGTNFIPTTSASNYPMVGDLVYFEARDAGETDGGHVETLKKITAQVTSVAAGSNSFTIGLEVEDDQNAIAGTFTVSTTAQDEVSMEIIARAQNPTSRCSQLARDVNVYSFALKPEEHQPSGTCNFSRIDSAHLHFSASATIKNSYAVNYNVLRIMSGMGGLAYSN
jgi:hypothetical protein